MSERENFIDRIIAGYLQLNAEERQSSCFIFPTRRACLIFRTRLAARLGTPSWSPGVMSIRDFVEVHSGVRIADEKELLLMLYGINEKYFPGQSFTRFSGWGQMLLNDFDEVDKQLESPDAIFTEIREIRQLESHFEHDAESLEWIREFTGIFDPEKLTSLQQKFAGNWDKIIHIYKEFRKWLNENQTGYEGLAYRKLLQMVGNGTFSSAYSSFCFAGFYGLSKVEEELVSALGSRFNVRMEWDADPIYITGIPNHEAGRYFRMRNDPGFLSEDHFTNRTLDISVTGVPMRSGQAKYAGHLLKKLLADGQLDPDKTAIILPDEGQLFPVLYSIPESIHPVNVTMGLPLRHTVYSELTTAFRNLICGARQSADGSKIYYHQHLSAVCENPLMQSFSFRSGKDREEGFRSWLRVSEIGEQYGQSMAELIAQCPVSPAEAPVWLSEIFDRISKANHGQSNSFDKVVCRFLVSELQELSRLLSGYGDKITLEDSMNITSDVVAMLKLPFSGEPVKGLQVMGFLETRALDFETVIILSCNEDILPKSSASRSFIPFSIRKAFGLSTFLEQDASSAYHFYRLLHRARKVFLVYDTEIRGLTGSEASRYILQLQHEFRFQPGIDINWHRQIVHTPVKPQQLQPAIIQKSPDILKILEGISNPSGEKGLSSTSLSVYISCSLRFYYSYVAKIKELDEDADSIEANVFGNILHTAMEKLYLPLTGTKVEPQIIQKLMASSDEAVDEAIRKEFKTNLQHLEGNDRILAGALKELVRRILQSDSAGPAFELISLENKHLIKLETSAGTFNLEGRFDRVDRIGDEVRIIDYKTGKVQIAAPRDTEKIFTLPKYKTLFQLFFYSMVYRKLNPGARVRPGFYVAQTLSEGVLFADAVNEENEIWFEERMKTLLEEIHDPSKPFEATADVERCEYCPFRDICMR